MATDEDMEILHRANRHSVWLLGMVLAIQLALWLTIILLVVFVPGVAHAQAPQVPQAANAYRPVLVRSAHAVWGLDAPVAAFAAQVHQESGWRPGAVSQVGATGLAQFMPSTARWISGIYPDLAANEPFNPGWALRALVTYDLWLHTRVQAADPCNRFAFVLSGYNGGLGWVMRDKALASGKGLDPLVWFDSVERVNAGRSAANWRENRDYPKRILQRNEPAYVAADWGPGVCP